MVRSPATLHSVRTPRLRTYLTISDGSTFLSFGLGLRKDAADFCVSALPTTVSAIVIVAGPQLFQVCHMCVADLTRPAEGGGGSTWEGGAIISVSSALAASELHSKVHSGTASRVGVSEGMS